MGILNDIQVRTAVEDKLAIQLDDINEDRQ